MVASRQKSFGELAYPSHLAELSPLAIEVCNERTGCKDGRLLSEWLLHLAAFPSLWENALRGGEHPAVRRFLW
jgi:hypothetical protein